MQYSAAVLVAIVGAASAQFGLPACASGAIGALIGGGSLNIGDLCTDKTGQASALQAELTKACSCEDLNKALGVANGLCPQPAGLQIGGKPVQPQDCSVKTTAPASTASVTSTVAPTTASASSSELTSTGSASSVTSAPVTSSVVTSSVILTYTSVGTVSGAPTQSTNGTVTSAAPSKPVSTGAASSVQVGGVAMVGAFLAALAL